MPRFTGLNTQVLGISIDHVPCLTAWADSLSGITYPLLSDFWPHGKVAKKYGVLQDDGRSERALFLIDKDGIIRYIDIHDIDDQPENEVLLAEIRKIDPIAAARTLNDEKNVPPQALPTEGVVLYCTRWCPGCRKARLWLDERNIEYTEINIHGHPQAADKVRKWANGNMTTPTLFINGEVIVDYNEEKMQQLLG